MSDLLEKLRNNSCDCSCRNEVEESAAEEIERLQTQLLVKQTKIENGAREIERLRELLKRSIDAVDECIEFYEDCDCEGADRTFHQLRADIDAALEPPK